MSDIGTKSSDGKQGSAATTAASTPKWQKFRKDISSPSFWDATATVSAVSFGARRLPEIKSLWSASMEDKSRNNTVKTSSDFVKALQSNGRKTSSRHLRRRATSHKRRKQHRFLPGEVSSVIEGNKNVPLPKLSRRMKRKKTALMQMQHEAWRTAGLTDPLESGRIENSNEDLNNEKRNDENPAKSLVESSSKIKNWIRTHIWHAKRFRMSEDYLWGWKVPLVHNNRGSQAALRLVMDGKCLLQDATWCMQPVWFQVNAGNNSSEISEKIVKSLARVIPNFSWIGALEEETCRKDKAKVYSSGEGIAHEIDHFPAGAIGPVSWICTNQSLVDQSLDNEGVCADEKKTNVGLIFYYFFAHPSIHSVLYSSLKAAIFDRDLISNILESDEKAISGLFSGIDGGVACLRIKGAISTTLLSDIISVAHENDRKAQEETDAVQLGSTVNDPGKTRHMESYTATAIVDQQKCKLLVRRLQPRDPNLRHNFGVCGHDIFCDPKVVQTIFLSLVLKGACPVGLVEETFLSSECDPPQLIFPRDFPDTVEGKSYWSGESLSWTLIRSFCEGGNCRMKLSKPIPNPSSFSGLAYNKDDCIEAGASVVVVRGAFGQPFQAALNGSGIVQHADHTGEPKKKKKKRSSGKMVLFTSTLPLSNQQAETHSNFCSSLIGSLSLPALLLCYVQVLGKGKFESTSRLYSNEPQDMLLGFVTTGTFSAARGKFHGIGIIGAARFLEAVALAPSKNTAVVTKAPNGEKRVQLKIRVAHQKQIYNGSIELLL